MRDRGRSRKHRLLLRGKDFAMKLHRFESMSGSTPPRPPLARTERRVKPSTVAMSANRILCYRLYYHVQATGPHRQAEYLDRPERPRASEEASAPRLRREHL